jgi:hypothetical protein
LVILEIYWVFEPILFPAPRCCFLPLSGPSLFLSQADAPAASCCLWTCRQAAVVGTPSSAS